jgi:hypothetical protein
MKWIRSCPRTLAAAVSFAVAATACVVLAPQAAAHHSVWSSLRFPNASIGFYFMSNRVNYSGWLYVDHNAPGCGAVEAKRANEVWMNIQNSTRGQSSMGRWANGVNMDNMGCTGSINSTGSTFYYTSNSMDTAIGWDKNQINFAQRNANGTITHYIGGRVRRQQAPSAYCTYWSTSYPCGSRSWVHMNWTKWSGASDTYKRRQILHETGHAHGLIDCPSSYYGMMMPGGSCGWDEGIIGWNADDRASVSSIYP